MRLFLYNKVMKPREVAYRYNKENAKSNKETEEKMCSVCNKVKSYEEYNNVSSNSTDGKAGRCRECTNALRYIAKDTPTTRALKYNKEHKEKNLRNNEKMCVTCNKVKSLELYNKDKASADGKQSKCGDCRRAFYTTSEQKKKARIYKDTPERKEYEKKRNKLPHRKEANRKRGKSEEGKQKRRAYMSKPENSKRASELKKAPHRRAKVNAYRKSKKSDPEFRAMNAMRGYIHQTIRNFNSKKEDKTREITGYSAEELIKHLNKGKYKWKDYMKNTKENILYHIDHIIPISYFVKKGEYFTDEGVKELIKNCNDLRNLRIWPADLNIIKHDDLDMDLIKQHGIEDLL